MEDKTGRNDPCPCGSGKKYKNCCTDKSSNGGGYARHEKWTSLNIELDHKLLLFSEKTHGRGAFDDAWEEFTFGDVDFSTESPHLQAFFPWFYHEWIPDLGKSSRDRHTIAADYLNRHSDRLTANERRYILANQGVVYGFWEVMDCEPGTGFRMKDVFYGTEADVEEHMGSRNAQAGDMFYCRVISLEESSRLNGCGALLIPPKYKPGLIRFRSEMRKLAKKKIIMDGSTAYSVELRHAYWDIYQAITAPPVLTNTDGELIEMHEMVFDIDSPDDAFDRLNSLCVSESPEDLLRNAKMEKSGRIRKIEFDWVKRGNPVHKTWDNTVLGNIRIEGNVLTVSVNSRKRADKIRKEIERRMKNRARFLTDKVQSLESMMKNTDRSSGRSHKTELENREMLERPEVQVLM